MSAIREEVVRVQLVVAQELVDVAMERVGPRLADGVDYPAGGPAILGRVVAGNHGEFLNRIHAHGDPGDAARAVRVIADAEPVEPVVVLSGPAPGDAQLCPKAAVPAERAALEGQLDFSIEAGDAGGKSGQLRPVAAVHGQLAYPCGFEPTDNETRAHL